MSGQLVLKIPDTVTAHFVVATAEPPADAYAAVRAAAGPLCPVILDLLGTPFLEIRVHLAGESGFAEVLGDLASPGDEEDTRVDKATHHLVVAGHAPPAGQPEHARAARAMARLLAAATDGVVADMRSNQVMPYDFRLRPERPGFCLADGWLAVSIDGDAGQVAVQTAGLHRFGLPDLEASGVPPDSWPEAADLLRCLAARMLTDHLDWLARNPDRASRPMGSHLWVDGTDLWRYRGTAPRPGAGDRHSGRADGNGQDARPLALRLRRVYDDCPRAPPYLTVVPPADFPGSRSQWWSDVVNPAVLSFAAHATAA